MNTQGPIDRGRMKAPLEQWEREAKERLSRRAAEETAAQAAETTLVPPLSGANAASGQPDTEKEGRLPKQPASESGEDKLPFREVRHGEDEGGGEETALSDNSAGLAVNLAAEVVILAAFVLLVCAVTFQSPLPPFLSMLNEPVPYAAAGAGLLLLAGLVGVRTLAAGFASLFTPRRKTAGAAAIAFLGGAAGFLPAVLHGAGAADAMPFALSACACLAFESWSRLLAARAERAGGAVQEMEPLCRASVRRAAVGDTGGEQDVVVPGETARSAGEREDDTNPNSGAASALSLAVLAIAALAACAALFLFRFSAARSLLVFAEFASIGAPLVMGVCVSLPLLGVSKALKRRGAALSGYSAVRALGCADALYLPDRLLYPDGQVQVCALRPMSKAGVEDAVLAAASVAAAAKMAIAPALREIFEGGETLLLPVERLQVVDEMGLEAWVEGRQILFGSRGLLRQKQVDLTGRMLLEVEAKYAVKGNDFIYLVVDGVPMALLILQYTAGKKIASALRRLTHAGVQLIAGTADPNITRDMLAERFRLNKRMVRLLPCQQMEEFQRPGAGQTDGAVLYVQNRADALARAVSACVRLESTARIVAAMQVIGTMANIALAGGVLLAQGRILEPLELLSVQLIWAVPPLLLAVFRKYA